MGEIEAVGDAMTGGLLARQMDRGGHHGDGGGHGICLNCGTELKGAHCHQCGQAAHIHRSIGAIFHEILHGVAHLEGRVWNTLPMLAIRPGELTRRYIHGERAHFVSPMAMFLFAVFTMFAVLQIMGVSPPAKLSAGNAYYQQLEEARQEAQATLKTVERDLKKTKPDSAAAKALEDRSAQLRVDLNMLKNMQVDVGVSHGKGNRIDTGWDRLDKGMAKALENPSLALYKLQTNSYKFSWALIPLSIPFVWLLFAWRREYRGYDHAVFVTYSLAFMSLLLIVLMIAGALGATAESLLTVGVLIAPIHIFLQLRGAYRLSKFGALVRTILLLSMITIILMLFLLLLLSLGFMG